MIRHVCIHCSTPLMLDDAFAGGNCRCQRCKTIQRVAAPAEAIAAASLMAAPAPRLVRVRVPTLRGGRKHQKSVAMVAVGAGVLLAAVVPMLFFLVKPTELGAGDVSTGKSASAQAANGSVLAGVPIKGRSVVFLIDRGQASAEATPFFIGSSLQAASTLPANRQFALIFWDNGTPPLAYPITGMAPAGAPSTDVARKSLRDFATGGSSDALTTIDRVMARHPDQIVILTAKAGDLPDDFVQRFEAAIRQPPGDVTPPAMPVISVLSVGSESASLAELAARTGGTFRVVTPDGLRHTIQQY